MIPKTVSALDAGTPPDVAYADVYDFQVAGKWAFDGKLEDITDVIAPMKDRFAPNTVETAFLYNDKTKKKAYYAFPLKQQTMHIQYWIDMLGEAGFKESDIPTDVEGTTGRSGATRSSRRSARRRQAHLRHRPADGRRFERLVLLVPKAIPTSRVGLKNMGGSGTGRYSASHEVSGWQLVRRVDGLRSSGVVV